MIADVNGVQLNYEIHGQGEPLLWLHGFMGCGSDWQYVFPSPPLGYRLIAPDMRGHGASTNPSGSYSHKECAQDVLALLDELNIERVKAIGVSGGGITLLHIALQVSRIDRMVVVSAPPYFPAEARAIQKQYSEAMLSDDERRLMRARHTGNGQLEQLFAVARSFADSYEDVNFTPRLLSSIAVETLIVFGDRDPFYPIALATDLRAAIPQSYLWVVPNGGHSPIFGQDAPRFAETALKFLGGAWSGHSRRFARSG